MTKIVDNVSAATTGDVETNTAQMYGGTLDVIAHATSWNGAQVVFKVSADGGTTWYPLLDGAEQVSITEDGAIRIPSFTGLKLGAKVSGTPTALTVEVR